MRIVRFAILLAVAFALVISGAVAGAVGQALILGHSNSSGGSQTGLTANLSSAVLKVTQNGSGVPLSLVGPSDRPPLTVSSTRHVNNLNADRVDGKSAAAFLPSATYRTWQLHDVPPLQEANISASCDAGDVLLSGGFWNVNATTRLWDNYPADLDTWVVGVTTGGFANNIRVYAVCADLGAAH